LRSIGAIIMAVGLALPAVATAQAAAAAWAVAQR